MGGLQRCCGIPDIAFGSDPWVEIGALSQVTTTL